MQESFYHCAAYAQRRLRTSFNSRNPPFDELVEKAQGQVLIRIELADENSGTTS